MRARGPVVWAVLAVLLTGCRLHPSTSHHSTQPCRPPTLTVVGHGSQQAVVPVRPGQTLRLHGRDYTDDCAAGGAGTGRTIPKIQLILWSKHRVGAIATVHPHGPRSSFAATVRIPTTTFPGPAHIADVLGPPHGVVRLVVRR